MKRCISVVFVSILWAMNLQAAGCITETLRFSAADISFARYEGYDVVRMKDANGSMEPGSPDLPQVLLYALIPHDAEIECAEITGQSEQALSGRFYVAPAQPAYPLSRPDLRRRAAPNPAIYSSSALYPATLAAHSASGSACGFRIAGVTVSPLRYVPSEGKLVLLTSAVLKVHYRENARTVKTISQRQYNATAPLVRSLVFNDADLKRFAPRVRPDAISDVNFAIVTDEGFKNSFDSFKLWKTKKGFRTEVFTTSWVYSNYTGYDNPEKIRNFFRDYHAKKGLVYALLAGDVDKVPTRLVTTNLNPGKFASDLYFADLDSNWDSNNDHDYGEPRQDVVDGYCDIYTGRLPSDNTNQIGYFMHKDTNMEKHPPTAALKKLLLPSGYLFSGKHGSAVNNVIADSSSPGWLDVNLVDPSRYAVRDSLNKAFSLAHISSHGNWYGFVNQDSSVLLHNDDANSMTAASNAFSILYSIACYAGEFDNASHECIAENLVNRQNGGCVATILNSRFGYGSASATGFAASELLDFQFAGQFFKRDTFSIGQTLAAAKHVFREDAWKSLPNITMHAAVVELTLFGDPDLPMFEEIPAKLSATHANSINAGQQNITVTVGTRAPVAGALVCCYKEGEVHQTAYANGSGQVNLSINPATNGVMYVTATAKDCLPYEGLCNIGPAAVSWGGSFAHGTVNILAVKSDRTGALHVRYMLAKPLNVSAALYDSRGIVVKNTNTHGSNPGIHTLVYNGLGSGVYCFRLSAGGHEIRRMSVMIK